MFVRRIGWALGMILVLAAPGTVSAGEESAWLGFFLGDALDGGVQIVAVLPEGPAARGGLRRGDVVLTVGGRETADRLVLGEAVDRFRPGDIVPIRILRDGRVEERRIVAGRAPVAFSWRREDPPSPVSPLGVEAAGDRWLGSEFREIPTELRVHFGAPESAGLLVVSVEAGSASSEAGIRVGDVVVRVAGKPVSRVLDVVLASAAGGPERAVPVEAIRAGKPLAVRLTVPESPSATPGAEFLLELARRDEEIQRLREEVQRLRRALEGADPP